MHIVSDLGIDEAIGQGEFTVTSAASLHLIIGSTHSTLNYRQHLSYCHPPMTATLNLILETLANQKISARLAEFPDYVVIADTREAAIAAIQQQLSDRLKTIEFVSILLPISTQPDHNLTDSFGVFKDDPYFAEILQRMRNDRELDLDNPAYT